VLVCERFTDYGYCISAATGGIQAVGGLSSSSTEYRKKLFIEKVAELRIKNTGRYKLTNQWMSKLVITSWGASKYVWIDICRSSESYLDKTRKCIDWIILSEANQELFFGAADALTLIWKRRRFIFSICESMKSPNKAIQAFAPHLRSIDINCGCEQWHEYGGRKITPIAALSIITHRFPMLARPIL